MASDGKWLQLITINRKWLQVIAIDHKLSQVIASDEIDCIDPNWSQLIASEHVWSLALSELWYSTIHMLNLVNLHVDVVIGDSDDDVVVT